MFQLSANVGELILRAVTIYVGLFFIFRLVGKKQLGQMSPFDLVLLLIVSESISNGLSGKDDSITGGLVSAFTLVALGAFIDRLAYKFKGFEKFVEGESQVVIEDGKLNSKILERFKITQNELEECLRDNQIEKIADTKKAVLETNGRITALKRDDEA